MSLATRHLRPAAIRGPFGTCARACALALCLALLGSLPRADAGQSLAQREELAVKAAVAQAAPSIVRIETVGGLERVGQILIGTGPTTGVIVGAEGLIVSSAFNFVQKPDSILVTLADGTRLPARLVATDHSRMLVLLSVHSATPLVPAEAVPPDQMHVGQWAIAVGRTLAADTPNVSVGIVSALDRVWGRAVQTDAKISPTNYGGPLIDISGRVLGLLVPLSPESNNSLAGVEWYDSGIGFAVPLISLQSVLPRLAAGNDLYPGLLGIGMKGGDPIGQAPVIAACRPHSPASEADLHVGDTIVEIDGKPVARQSQFKQELSRHYAGDRVRLVVMRAGQRVEHEVELAEKIPPYAFPFAGILPLRPVAGKPDGLVVRFVYPDSPAARAGIQAGDQIVTLGGEAVQSTEQALRRLRTHVPGDKLAVGLARQGQAIAAELTLTELPDAVPAELPAAHAAAEAKAAEPAVGVVTLASAETKAKCLAYVPKNYRSDLRYGVVIWLHGDPVDKQDELIARWKPLCEAHDLILLAPEPLTDGGWKPADVRAVRESFDELSKNYAIDPTRVVVHGYKTGAMLAYLYAVSHIDTVRGVAATGSPLPGWLTLPENDPANRLAVFSSVATQNPVASMVEAGLTRFRAMKYPVTEKSLGDEPRYLNADELAELVRWIDTLDRF